MSGYFNFMTKYLFIDRDGTLVKEPYDYQVDALCKISFCEYVFPALLALKDEGYKFIMVSNQDGLGTDSFPLNTFTESHEFIVDAFESQGIIFDEILICPHKESDNCDCRKPKLGMVMAYMRDLSWDRENSYFIGDRETDMLMAKSMGIKGLRLSDNYTWLNILHDIKTKDREALVTRETKETKIKIYVNLDKKDKSIISTKIGFFDHMLDQIATHAGIYMNVDVVGDLHIDAHHTIEDTALVLGSAIKKALGDKKGIARFGFVLPMDEVYASVFASNIADSSSNDTTLVSLDISGRPYCKLDLDAIFTQDMIGDYPVHLTEHFFQSLATTLGLTLNM